MNLVRRTILKGLMAVGAAPLLSAVKVQAAPVSFSHAEIQWYNILDMQKMNVEFNDKNDKDGVLRAYVDAGLKWFDDTASSINDAEYRNLTIEHHKKLLDPLKAKRDVYEYGLMCDERNHWPKVLEQNIKHVDAFIIPPRLAIGRIVIKFTHDPLRPVA